MVDKRALLARSRGTLQSTARRFGYDISRVRAFDDYPGAVASERAALRIAQGRTMASPNRVLNFIEAVRYASTAMPEAAVVECGVWRGGMIVAAAQYLLSARLPLVHLYLFDTFQGMTKPTDEDRLLASQTPAVDLGWSSRPREATFAPGVAAYATLEDVQEGLALTGYPSELVTYVVGPVEETLPAMAPPRVSVARLDTDWYASTRHELTHLWPRVVDGGVVILDDYDYWSGARLAVDEFLEQQKIIAPLLRMDEGRILVKR